MTVHLVKWMPFRLACTLHCLQQGTLNVGNRQQNRANLKALAITNANGARSWARWGTAINDQKNETRLFINYKAVPGYVPPVGTND
jgi:hypothetical protein